MSPGLRSDTLWTYRFRLRILENSFFQIVTRCGQDWKIGIKWGEMIFIREIWWNAGWFEESSVFLDGIGEWWRAPGCIGLHWTSQIFPGRMLWKWAWIIMVPKIRGFGGMGFTWLNECRWGPLLHRINCACIGVSPCKTLASQKSVLKNRVKTLTPVARFANPTIQTSWLMPCAIRR